MSATWGNSDNIYSLGVLQPVTRGGHPPVLLDDLGGAGEDRGWHGEAEGLGSLEIDHQLERGRLLDRQIGRLSPFQGSPRVTTGLAPDRDFANSIADQPAGLAKPRNQ
jgi:hypothetical protein